MKLKNTLLLFVLAVGLFAFIKFYDSQQLSSREAQERAGKVASFDRGFDLLIPDQTHGFDLTRPDRPPVVIQREGRPWLTT